MLVGTESTTLEAAWPGKGTVYALIGQGVVVGFERRYTDISGHQIHSHPPIKCPVAHSRGGGMNFPYPLRGVRSPSGAKEGSFSSGRLELRKPPARYMMCMGLRMHTGVIFSIFGSDVTLSCLHVASHPQHIIGNCPNTSWLGQELLLMVISHPSWQLLLDKLDPLPEGMGAIVLTVSLNN